MLKQILAITLTASLTVALLLAACFVIPKMGSKSKAAESDTQEPSVTVNTFVDPELNACVSKEVIVYEPNGFWDELKEKYFPTPDTIRLHVNEDKLRFILSERNDALAHSTETITLADDRTALVTIGQQYDIEKILSAAYLHERIDVENYYAKSPALPDWVIEKYKSWRVDYPSINVYYTLPEENVSVSADGSTLRIDLTFMEGILVMLSENETLLKHEELDFMGKHLSYDGQGTVRRELNVDEEFAYLKNTLLTGSMTNVREAAVTETTPRNDEVVIFIDLDAQHLRAVRGDDHNAVIMESDVVTGDIASHHNTMPGVYYVSECINGKYLTPVPGGPKTWVDKWMRVTNGGVGMHDAGWRRAFGGNIYRYDGSHGCINLPKKFAYDLFPIVSVGTRVYIYDSTLATVIPEPEPAPEAAPEETAAVDENNATDAAAMDAANAEAPADANTTVDAAAPADANTTVDAAAPADANMTVDAAAPADANTSVNAAANAAAPL